MTELSDKASSVDWAWAGAAFEGSESGDRQVVVSLPYGSLLAVIDGLGHGEEAAVAALEAQAVLEGYAASPVGELLERCHEALRKTRGAVMSLASFDRRSSTIDWCGVGNVEGIVFRANKAKRPAREALSTRGGVVGYRLPLLKVNTVQAEAGDVLVLATDGIHSDFSSRLDLEGEPQELADSILIRHSKGTDDALVLVARFVGGSP